jgi:hypothetical protein
MNKIKIKKTALKKNACIHLVFDTTVAVFENPQMPYS